MILSMSQRQNMLLVCVCACLMSKMFFWASALLIILWLYPIIPVDAPNMVSTLWFIHEIYLTIYLVPLSHWFPGSHTCPPIRSRWRQELWCPRVPREWTTYSPSCCHTPQGILGWLLSLQCLLMYHHMLLLLQRERHGGTVNKESCNIIWNHSRVIPYI